MFPPENPNSQPIILKCWFWFDNRWCEGQIEEASAETGAAQIIRRGCLVPVRIRFSSIRNIALAYGYTGEILESFGSPRRALPIILEGSHAYL